MTERSFRLQVTILAGVCREGGGAHGAQHWNYLHNCSVKAILKEEGNKELSVWAAPFGQIEILSAAIAPPTHRTAAILPLGLIMKVGLGGHQCHIL